MRNIYIYRERTCAKLPQYFLLLLTMGGIPEGVEVNTHKQTHKRTRGSEKDDLPPVLYACVNAAC